MVSKMHSRSSEESHRGFHLRMASRMVFRVKRAGSVVRNGCGVVGGNSACERSNPWCHESPPHQRRFLRSLGAANLAFFREEGLELFVGVVEAGAEGSFRHVGHFGDFREGEALDVREGDHLLVGGGEL